MLTAAGQLNDSQVDVLVHGADCSAQVEQVKKYAGVSSVLVAQDSGLQNSYGDSVARVVKQLV